MPEPAPTPAPADRNLLFGILALQMDFIGRDALVQAMNAWVLTEVLDVRAGPAAAASGARGFA
jgi:hypothetical protein